MTRLKIYDHTYDIYIHTYVMDNHLHHDIYDNHEYQTNVVKTNINFRL